MTVLGMSCSKCLYVAPMIGTGLGGSAYVFGVCMYLLRQSTSPAFEIMISACFS